MSNPTPSQARSGKEKLIERCCASVNKSPGCNWPRFAPCGRTARVQHEGRWYCGTHDPAAVKARSDKQYEKYQSKWKRRDALHAQSAAALEFVQQCAADRDDRISPGLKEKAQQILNMTTP